MAMELPFDALSFDGSEEEIGFVPFDATFAFGEEGIMEIGGVARETPAFRTVGGGSKEFASAVGFPAIEALEALDDLDSVNTSDLLDTDRETVFDDRELMDGEELDERPMTERDATVPLDLNRLERRMGQQKAVGSSGNNNLKC
jgi:hypothetical protein